MSKAISRTVISVTMTDITVKVTEEDMTKELIKEVESKYITPDEIKEITPGVSPTDN